MIPGKLVLTCGFLGISALLVRYLLLRTVAADKRAREGKYPGGYRRSRLSFLDHQGNETLLVDLTNCTPPEAIQTLQWFEESLQAQPAYSILTTQAIIDLTDARLTPESIAKMSFVITENQRFLARLAFTGHRSLHSKTRREILRLFLRRYPFFGNIDDALDFVEHDDEYPIYFSPRSQPQQHIPAYWMGVNQLCELFSRLLRSPDDSYQATAEQCVASFDHARTRKLRLMTAFLAEIKDLSTTQMQTLYIETFERDPVLSLDMSYQLGETQKEKERLLAWMESRCIKRQVCFPAPFLPMEHLSNGLFLMSRIGTASTYGEDFEYVLSPVIRTLMSKLKGRNNPYEKLLTVIGLVLDRGGDMYVARSE